MSHMTFSAFKSVFDHCVAIFMTISTSLEVVDVMT